MRFGRATESRYDLNFCWLVCSDLQQSGLRYCMMASISVPLSMCFSLYFYVSLSLSVSWCLCVSVSPFCPLSVYQYVFPFTCHSWRMLCMRCLPFPYLPIFTLMPANTTIIRESTWNSPEAITLSLLPNGSLIQKTHTHTSFFFFPVAFYSVFMHLHQLHTPCLCS